MNEEHKIPAATIQDVDLSGVNPTLASEIRRLGNLMERGEETSEQFAQLVRLLHQVGHSRKAEHLLRRNIDVLAGDLALYRELFGTEKPDEFEAAIEGFKEQFVVELEFLQSRQFLISEYRTVPRLARFDEFRLLSEPCEVCFGYIDENVVEADVSSLEMQAYLILQWIDGVWEIIGPSSR